MTGRWLTIAHAAPGHLIHWGPARIGVGPGTHHTVGGAGRITRVLGRRIRGMSEYQHVWRNEPDRVRIFAFQRLRIHGQRRQPLPRQLIRLVGVNQGRLSFGGGVWRVSGLDGCQPGPR
jgi:hypothetical protein